MTRLGHASALLLVLTVVAPPAAAAPCQGEPYDLARRFEGRWHELTLLEDGGEELVGTLTARLEAGGCAFRQSFESVDGGFSFESVGYVDPESGMWHEVFVLSTGRVAHYRWRMQGEDVVMDHVEGAPGVARRLRVRDLAESSYLVLEEHSVDGGASWRVVETTWTRRVDD